MGAVCFLGGVALACRPAAAGCGSIALGRARIRRRDQLFCIAVGFLGCVCGGRVSLKLDSVYVAAFALLASGLLCLIYPLLPSDWLLLRFLVLLAWGFFVVADSPQFSSISARSCPPQWVGSALAIQNSIGFLITIVSITLLLSVIDVLGSKALWILLPGPILGLMGMWPLLKKTSVGGAA